MDHTFVHKFSAALLLALGVPPGLCNCQYAKYRYIDLVQVLHYMPSPQVALLRLRMADELLINA